jgi:hypothetical protein
MAILTVCCRSTSPVEPTLSATEDSDFDEMPELVDY